LQDFYGKKGKRRARVLGAEEKRKKKCLGEDRDFKEKEEVADKLMETFEGGKR